tara:strand:- start:6337 stop:6483 length:147 start_codon:yes stop_codon:yes gene_type:complete
VAIFLYVKPLDFSGSTLAKAEEKELSVGCILKYKEQQMLNEEIPMQFS